MEICEINIILLSTLDIPQRTHSTDKGRWDARLCIRFQILTEIADCYEEVYRDEILTIDNLNLFSFYICVCVYSFEYNQLYLKELWLCMTDPFSKFKCPI